MELVEQALAGNRYALARLISLVEDSAGEARDILGTLSARTGQAHVVGVTGPPGTGKSTLVNALARCLRDRGLTVGVVAVDPSSPLTGGALLGDRIRMRDLAGDPGVFVRSMAARGNTGGLAQATSDVVKVLDAAGFAVIMVETVGAGQSEMAIARIAHTVVVVEAPGLGDEVQALKAGLLEIADILVVNKADRPGADQTAAALEMAANRNTHLAEEGWRPPILKTCALHRSGVAELGDQIAAHRHYLQASGQWVRREESRARAELFQALQEGALERLLAAVGGEASLQCWVARIAGRDVDAHTAARTILDLGAEGAEAC